MPELSLGPAALTLGGDVEKVGEKGHKRKGSISRNGELAFPMSSFHYQNRCEVYAIYGYDYECADCGVDVKILACAIPGEEGARGVQVMDLRIYCT